jgi:hypothetical protein
MVAWFCSIEARNEGAGLYVLRGIKGNKALSLRRLDRRGKGLRGE